MSELATPRSRPVALAALLFAAAALAVSCEAPRAKSDGAITATQFTDLPVPPQMQLRDNSHQSHSLQIGEYRYGDFLYSGMMPMAELASYLLQRMPRHSWELDGDETTAEFERHLRFHRGKYQVECILTKPEIRTELRIQLRTSEESQAKS